MSKATVPHSDPISGLRKGNVARVNLPQLLWWCQAMFYNLVQSVESLLFDAYKDLSQIRRFHNKHMLLDDALELHYIFSTGYAHDFYLR